MRSSFTIFPRIERRTPQISNQSGDLITMWVKRAPLGFPPALGLVLGPNVKIRSKTHLREALLAIAEGTPTLAVQRYLASPKLSGPC